MKEVQKSAKCSWCALLFLSFAANAVAPVTSASLHFPFTLARSVPPPRLLHSTQTIMVTTSPPLTLPEELWLIIVDDHLTMESMITLAQTNRTLRRICDWKHPSHRPALKAYADPLMPSLSRMTNVERGAKERALQFLWQEDLICREATRRKQEETASLGRTGGFPGLLCAQCSCM